MAGTEASSSVRIAIDSSTPPFELAAASARLPAAAAARAAARSPRSPRAALRGRSSTPCTSSPPSPSTMKIITRSLGLKAIRSCRYWVRQFCSPSSLMPTSITTKVSRLNRGDRASSRSPPGALAPPGGCSTSPPAWCRAGSGTSAIMKSTFAAAPPAATHTAVVGVIASPSTGPTRKPAEKQAMASPKATVRLSGATASARYANDTAISTLAPLRAFAT
mmetsp:Transcript_50737/g.162423  ORF Transcript_50737/g.162423 Transcript_50737/m.162423 type:complete len:220 (+) Transcript_50737:269-928(+)